MKNSIEENIKEIECFFKRNYFVNYDWTIIHRNSMANLEDSIEDILSDYKRVLKENESLQKTYDDCYCKYKHYKQFESISVQKVKDKIEKYDKQRIKMEKDDIGVGFTLGKEWSDLKAKIESLQELLEKE